MKKYAILLTALAVVLMVGCEGDDPGGGGGTLPQITGLSIDWDASDGRDIVLTWTAEEEAEEYEIYFKTTSGGNWSAVTTTTNTTFTHTDATSAGYYSVRAKSGDDYSEEYATAVNTMPIEISNSYTIYDNYAAEDLPSGIYFDFDQAYTGSAYSPDFGQDIYAYEEGKGDTEVIFRSGDMSPGQGGYPTVFWSPGSTYGYPESNIGSYTSNLASGDIFILQLDGGYFAKLYVDDVAAYTGSDNGTEVDLHYEIQDREGIQLFTTKSN